MRNNCFLKKKRILYLHANNEDIGGADYCLLKLVCLLDKNCFHPIVCLSKKTRIFSILRDNGIDVRIIKMIRIQNRKKFDYLKSLILNFLPTISHLNKIIKNEDINIVHSNDLFDVYGPIAAFVNRTPSIQHIRWILNSNTIIKYLISIYIALVNTKIIAVSNGVVNRMLLVPKFLKSKVTVCYDWVDFKLTGIMHIDNNLRNIFKISKDSVIICTIGRLDPWKGQDIFIKAASLISIEFKNVYFLVVGGSVQGKGRENYTEELIQLAIKENISDRIYFAGERNDI